MTDSSRIVVASSSLAAEAYLIGELERLRPESATGSRIAALGPPARVVVPSHSLRQHLLARLASVRPAWLGLEVVTLSTAARAILGAAGEVEPRGGLLLPVLLERAAARRRPLANAFGGFTDGWAVLAAAARDLTDAGFVPELAEALVERVDAERGALPIRSLERAKALIEALAEALSELARLGLAPESARLFRAAELVAERGGGALPASALFVHGFADATGAASDLLAALVRHASAIAVLVDPFAESRASSARPAGSAAPFGSRLRERLEGAGGPARSLGEARTDDDGARGSAIVAPSRALEAAALARAARAAIDRGLRPELIAVVVRDLGTLRSEFGRAFERRGVPFSSAVGPPSPLVHRARSLSRLLGEKGEITAEAALELLDALPVLGGGTRASVRLALRALGVARLSEVETLDLERIRRFEMDGFPLPIRSGIESAENGGELAAYRRVAIAPILLAIERLRSLLRAADRWPATATLHDHRARLKQLLGSAGLAEVETGRQLVAAIERATGAIPSDLRLAASEAFALFGDAWSAFDSSAPGRAGGGIQLLSVTEARGRTFDLLFVADVARGSFPRAVTEDPVLPDRLRNRLRDLLPDLPVKSEGHAEERFLFEQLLGSASGVVLSRAAFDDDGRELPASPLLDALERNRPLPRHEIDDRAPEPELERAITAGERHGRAALAPHLEPLLAEGARRFAPGARLDVARTAAARFLVLTELDNDPRSAEGRLRMLELGPYFGLLGAGSTAIDSWATTLERTASCAWQAFLERELRLGSAPDPLAALPGLDPIVVGVAVHAALAELFPAASPDERVPLADQLAPPGRPLVWPTQEETDRVAGQAALRVLVRAGFGGRGLEPLLARAVIVRLAVARSEDQRRGAVALVGSELVGELSLDERLGGPARIGFRVDRVHREGARSVFVDWKSGKVPEKLDGTEEAARHSNLLQQIRSGTRLQAALYAAASPAQPAEGRYVFLRPDDDAPERSLGVEADSDARAALEEALAVLVEARRRGLFPPRLLEPKLDKEFEGCRSCEVAEACVRGDSGFRLRLERWHEHQQGLASRRSPGDAALWRLWRLPMAGKEPA